MQYPFLLNSLKVIPLPLRDGDSLHHLVISSDFFIICLDLVADLIGVPLWLFFPLLSNESVLITFDASQLDFALTPYISMG